MAKQELSDIEKYNATFPTLLRKLMNRHPHHGHTTTQKALAEILDLRPQTLSLYMKGLTQPSPDTLVNIAKYFNVSVDYLLMGVSSFNKETNKELGLSEEAIRLLQNANVMDSFNGMPTVIETINNMLSDRDFYEFLYELSFKTNAVRSGRNMPPEQKSNLGNMDIEGYRIWDLQMFIQKFIRKQLGKNGLGIDRE